MLKISIIIPTINEAKNLPLLLSDLSIIQKEAEIIIVDSGSEDKTIDIANIYFFVDKIADSRLRFFSEQTCEIFRKCSKDFIKTLYQNCMQSLWGILGQFFFSISCFYTNVICFDFVTSSNYKYSLVMCRSRRFKDAILIKIKFKRLMKKH